jgi:hypothetical protein
MVSPDFDIRKEPNPRLGSFHNDIGFRLVRNVRQQGDLTGALNGDHQLALVLGADTGRPAGQDLAALGNIAADLRGVLIIYRLALVDAELTYFSALAAVASVISAVSAVSAFSIVSQDCILLS